MITCINKPQLSPNTAEPHEKVKSIELFAVDYV